MVKHRGANSIDSGDFASEVQGLAATSEWPLDRMPPMPLEKGLAMVISANNEMSICYGVMDMSLHRQHVLAAYESDRRWRADQSRLDTEVANRFGILATGWAKLASAFLAPAL